MAQSGLWEPEEPGPWPGTLVTCEKTCSGFGGDEECGTAIRVLEPKHSRMERRDFNTALRRM